jgi:hypothetical protein
VPGHPSAPARSAAQTASQAASAKTAPTAAVHRAVRRGKRTLHGRPPTRAHRIATRLDTAVPGQAIEGRPMGDAGRRRHAARSGGLGSTLRKLSGAALKVVGRFSFPLILALLVIAFLALQDQIDRKDPKLRLAPIDTKHDLRSFV